MTGQEFLDKIDSEGGIEMALASGLTSDDCENEDLANMWDKLVAWFESPPPEFYEVEGMLLMGGLDEDEGDDEG